MENLDFTKPGSYEGPLTIRKLTMPSEGGRFGDIWFEGIEQKFSFFANARFLDRLKKGANEPASLKWEPRKGGGEGFFFQLANFGAAQKGGGQGRAFTPKSKEEIHAGAVASIIAAAISLDRALDQVEKHIDVGLKKYFEAMQRLGTTVPERQATSSPAAKPHGQESAAKIDPKRDQALATLAELGFSKSEISTLEAACAKRSLDMVSEVIRLYAGGYSSKQAIQARIKEFPIVEREAA